MGEKIPTAKIVIDESHELTDLVREIHRSKAERIVLTFTEQTDILISPINLKVLQEAAEREGKLLISQVIQNPTGIRNSKLAGIKTIDTPSNPTEYDWEDAFEMIQTKKKEKLEKKKGLDRVIIKEEDENELFEEKVEDTLEKTEIPTREPSKYLDKRGIKSTTPFISIDTDIPSTDQPPMECVLPPVTPIGPVPLKKKYSLNIFKNLKTPKTGVTLNKKKFLKIFLFIFIPLVFLLILGAVLYNQFATFVKVRLFVESKPVQIESILTGDENIKEIDFENLKVPIKKDEKTKSLSDSITATGKAYKGEKATGTITLTYFLGDGCPEIESEKPILKLPSGAIISTSTYSYKLVNAVEIVCNNNADIQVIAADIGEEYNIPSGKSFSVEGYSNATVFGLNKAAFTGGTKQEYTVLSQLDVDNAIEQLSTTAIEEVKSELRKVTGGWEIIEDTVLSEVDKSSIKTDKKVGTEATTVNLDLTIKGTATYYQTTGLTEKLTDLLREKAQEENLFETEGDLELVLGDAIEKSITIEESTKGAVKIKIVAKSSIKPKVDKDKLAEELKGMEWEEGREYLASLKYAERKPEVVFNPNNYPAFLKRFPDRRGGVLVSITELEVEK